MKRTTTRLNLANQEHFDRVIEDFGGEAYLSREFPRILQMIRDTAEYHRNTPPAAGLNDEEIGYDSGLRLDIYDGIPANAAETAAGSAAFTSRAPRYARSDMKLTSPASSIVIRSYMYKMQEGRPIKIASDSGLWKNTDHSVFHLKADPNILFKTKGADVSAETFAYIVRPHENGKDMMDDSFHETAEVYENPVFDEIVKKCEVIDPRPKTPFSPYITIVFNRSDSDAAYTYTGENPRIIDGIKYVPVHEPINIKVTLNDECSVVPKEPFDPDSFIAFLSSEVIRGPGGNVYLNSSYLKYMKSVVNKNELTVTLKSDGDTWGAEMPLASVGVAKGIFDIYVSFTVNYTLAGSQDVYGVDIIVSSSDDFMPSPCAVKIDKKIYYMWGCLGQDTVVITPEGEKKITEISKGSRVLAEGGDFVLVTNVVTGQDAEMVLVNSTDKNHAPLLLTKNHFIKTRRGVVRADDLSAADDLEVSGGEFVAAGDLRLVPYTGTVYSLTLEKPAYHFADDFLVSSYNVPARPEKEDAKEEPAPVDPVLARELKEWHAAQKLIHQSAVIETVKESAEAEWLAYEGVHSVGIGFKQTGGAATKDLSILVFTEKKKPAGAVRAGELLPASVSGIPVDVIEAARPELCLLPVGPGTRPDETRYRPILGGIQLYLFKDLEAWAGTLCTFVKSNHSNKTCLLTVRDVLDTAGLAVHQPLPGEGNIVAVASVVAHYPDANAAIAEVNLDASQIAPAYVQDLGRIKGAAPVTSAYLGKTMRKRGRTTQVTEGILAACDATIQVSDTLTYHHQCLIKGTDDICGPGDSGSPVLTGDNYLAGILWGKFGEYAAFSNIKNVFQALDIHLLEPPETGGE